MFVCIYVRFNGKTISKNSTLPEINVSGLRPICSINMLPKTVNTSLTIPIKTVAAYLSTSIAASYKTDLYNLINK